MEHHLPEEHPMACHLTSIEEEDEEEDAEEHFPTALLNDDVWMEEPVQTSTYAFMNIHNMICAHTHACTAWISYTSLWIMHHSTWTSATFLTSLM